MKNTIIFDLDGTLLDSIDDIMISVNYCLELFGHKPRTRDEVRSFVGNGPRALIKSALGGETEDYEEVFQSYLEYYSNNSSINTKPYAGVTEILRILKSDGYKLAILSNKQDSAVTLMCKKYFDGLFDLAIGSKDSIKRKPNPDMLFKAIEDLGSTVEESIYVGDSEVDILTAKNANIDLVMVAWGYRDREVLEDNGAEIIIDTAHDLLKEIIIL